MEGNGFSGRLFSNIGGGILGLEMALQPQPQNPNPNLLQQHTQQHPQQQHHPQQHPQQQHPQMVGFSLPPPPHHHQQFDHQTQLSMRQPSNSFTNPNPNPNPNPAPKPKTQTTQMANSDEDEPGFPNEDNSSFDGKRKSVSPWHRMKWTDSMVRLLIMAVYYIGDEGGSELGSEKKKGGNGGGGQLQKKGKWKSVSRAMMEKGFCVSPQQCEDKFNDLNKRYKRVNEILGKGTACKVVENQTLLETMDHLSPKMKEEVRKLLNSKHLFFREMCAYHNSCGHVSGSGSASQGIEASHSNPPPAMEVPSQQQPYQQPQPHQQHQQQNLCLHSSIPTPSPPSSSMVHSSSRHEDHDFDDDSDSDSDSDEESDDERAKKRARTTGGISSSWALPVQQLTGDLTGVLQDGSKSSWEKKQWVLTQLSQLEEQGVKFQYQALEIEKQRMKWMKFSSKKEREMDRNKIENERKRLETERMVLLLRQKEIELFMIEQRPSNLSSVTG